MAAYPCCSTDLVVFFTYMNEYSEKRGEVPKRKEYPMKARKKGKQYEISYRCPGYSKPFYERFETIEEANLRAAQIELDKARGELHPPKALLLKTPVSETKNVTVRQLMDEFVQHYGLNHWGDSYLSANVHRIEHYINPYLGDILLKELTARDLDIYYDTLQEEPAVILKGHTDTEKRISASVIERIHVLLRSALNLAVRWGYIQVNPAEHVTPPEYHKSETAVWSVGEALRAIECCDDHILRLAMLLALGCSMRIGEILGLQWDHVSIEEQEITVGNAFVYIDKELKRCKTESLKALEGRGRSKIIFKFPDVKKSGSTTSLVLKSPKTASSVRRVYLAKTVAVALQRAKEEQNREKAFLGEAYQDFGLVIAHEDGRPYEERQIMKLLKKLIADNQLTPVVFHSLRHCSTSIKLQLSGGDIKAVQGDTGHAQARMVTDLYAHIDHEDRRRLAMKMEGEFFRKSAHAQDQKAEAEGMTEVIGLLHKNPEIMNLLVAMIAANNKAG